jgi:hypothetical protein
MPLLGLHVHIPESMLCEIYIRYQLQITLKGCMLRLQTGKIRTHCGGTHHAEP